VIVMFMFILIIIIIMLMLLLLIGGDEECTTLAFPFISFTLFSLPNHRLLTQSWPLSSVHPSVSKHALHYIMRTFNHIYTYIFQEFCSQTGKCKSTTSQKLLLSPVSIHFYSRNKRPSS